MVFAVSLYVLPQIFAMKGVPFSGTHKTPVWDGRKAALIPSAKHGPDVRVAQPMHFNEDPTLFGLLSLCSLSSRPHPQRFSDGPAYLNMTHEADLPRLDRFFWPPLAPPMLVSSAHKYTKIKIIFFKLKNFKRNMKG